MNHKKAIEIHQKAKIFCKNGLTNSQVWCIIQAKLTKFGEGGDEMYKNLEAEMIRNGVTRNMVADELHINVSTLSAKMNVPDRMKLCEAQRIQKVFFPQLELSYLFAKIRRLNP